MQIILNFKSAGDISKSVQIGSTFCVTYYLFYSYKMFTRPFCIFNNLTNFGSYDHPYCTLYTVHCTVYSVQCKVYTHILYTLCSTYRYVVYYSIHY